MTELAAAAGQALAPTRFVAVTGRQWDGFGPLVEAASEHVVAPGPTTRLTVAAGVGIGGRPAVVLVDHAPSTPPPDPSTTAVTASAGCALGALHAGWAVVQPWSPTDMAALLDVSPRPAMFLLGDHRDSVDVEAPHPRPARQWQHGDMATLVGSGASVGPMVRLADRLEARGVGVSVVEVAVLETPWHAPLVGGRAVLVAGPRAASVFRRGHWPDEAPSPIVLEGTEEADLVGQVLAHVAAV